MATPTETSLTEKRDHAAKVRSVRRSLLWVVAVVLAINGALIYRVLVSPEPSFRGRTITQWIELGGPNINPRIVNAFGPEAWPHLMAALQAKDSELKRFYRTLWMTIPNAMRTKLGAFRPVHPTDTSFNAEFWFPQLGPGAAAAVPDLIELSLSAEDLEVRCKAVEALSFAGRDSPEALAALFQLLKELLSTPHPNAYLKEQTVLALGRFGAEAQPALPLLVKSIEADKEADPSAELLVLGRIGPAAAEAVPALVQCLSQPDLQKSALTALSGLGPGAAAAVPVVLPFLRDSDYMKRLLAIEVLSSIGPAAASALPELRRLETEETDLAQLLASAAIGKIAANPAHAVSLLASLLQAPMPGKLPEWPRRLTTPSKRLSQDIELGLRGEAAWHLGEAGAAGQPALAALQQVLVTGDAQLSALAARAIWRITRSTNQVLTALERVIGSGEDLPYFVTLNTLHEMGPGTQGVAPVLVKYVDDLSHPWIRRQEASKLLERLDPESQAAPGPDKDLYPK